MPVGFSPISDELVAQYMRSAREYPGGRLNVYAIGAKYRININTFGFRQRNGWRSLGWGKLASIPKKYTIGTEEREEPTYLESDVAKALVDPAGLDGRFQLNGSGPVFLTLERAAIELGAAIG